MFEFFFLAPSTTVQQSSISGPIDAEVVVVGLYIIISSIHGAQNWAGVNKIEFGGHEVQSRRATLAP